MDNVEFLCMWNFCVILVVRQVIHCMYLLLISTAFFLLFALLAIQDLSPLCPHMSALVMGRFSIMLCSTHFTLSLVLGHQMMSFTEQALQTSTSSLNVYLLLLLSTVLTRTMTYITSEKNRPFLEGLNPWLVLTALLGTQ